MTNRSTNYSAGIRYFYEPDFRPTGVVCAELKDAQRYAEFRSNLSSSVADYRVTETLAEPTHNFDGERLHLIGRPHRASQPRRFW